MMPDRIFVEQKSISDLDKMAQNIDLILTLGIVVWNICGGFHTGGKKGNLKNCEIQRTTEAVFQVNLWIGHF